MKYVLAAAILALSSTACAEETNSGLSGPEIPASEATKYLGVYAGSYVCSKGENGITVSLDTVVDLIGAEDPGTSKIDGRLWFYDVASNADHPEGAFTISGTIDKDGDIDMKPGAWLSDIPSGWGAAGVEGSIAEMDGRAAMVARPSGPGTEACEDFVLKRLEGL